ncbi:uncharacterized protein LOC131042467 isoform X2 [Cryptomeria japonica]|uniref:uncharacterized protein LOC131042467 isoform X2 n=1 Tax=Cryptomeria japonica TaxID=3369 RepID=UPI0027DA3585|nr:uncharacterized protein LOC131042467 isoform X2 [Cryptomeria japonica]
MFEAHVLHLLRKYLGEYVHGLSNEALKISVWKGDVVLKDLQLKAEALNSLKLPITVKAGFLGSVTLKVPWKSLGKEPVVVLIDRVFVLAEPAQDDYSFTEQDKERLFEAKRHQIEKAEMAMLEAKDKKKAKVESSPETNSWIGSLIATIVGNLKVSISNVHIRYEDQVSNPGHPFSSGITLAKLAAVTTDEHGVETFDTSGALDRLRKSLQLQSFAVYHDSNCVAWKVHKGWGELSADEWSEMFEAGIQESKNENGQYLSQWAVGRQYLLCPVNGTLQYYRFGKQEKRDPSVPSQKMSLILNDVSLTVSEAQYCDGMKLLEGISRYRTRIEVSHFRPLVSVSENVQAWWHYACQASLHQQNKMWYRLSWENVRRLCHLRRKYVQLYASFLQQVPRVENGEIKEIEKELDAKVIILWRLLAHARVESARSKEAALERERARKSSWWSFGWGTTTADSKQSISSERFESAHGTPGPGRLTKEEWNKLNELLSYDPAEDFSVLSDKEPPTMVQVSLDAMIRQSAARIVNNQKIEIMCGKFENLQVGLRLYPKSIHCDVKLKYYGLSAPEGSLIQSVSSEKKEYALATAFVYHPIGETIDWKLSATMAPCHVTIWMTSFERCSQFLKRSNSVSPEVALETATALQMKLEQVTRRAQEQFQLVLEEQSRFSLDIDLDAPKVRLPFERIDCSGSCSQLLIDFGHFTLCTGKEDEVDFQRASLYSRFYISGRDISAFFADGNFDWANLTQPSLDSAYIMDKHDENLIAKQPSKLFPILDKCGTSVVIDQIKLQHPSYPSTRISIQVPNLGLHFSAARYSRIMNLLVMFDEKGGRNDEMAGTNYGMGLRSWHPTDLAGDARVLFWGGIGNSVAEWQPCWLVLAGSYLYILESKTSQTYQRSCSMSAKQVSEIPATSLGGSEFSLAISNRGFDLQKALESSSTVILQFKDDSAKAEWMKSLVRATYKASAPPSICVPGDLSSDESEDEISQPAVLSEMANLFVIGSLIELKLLIYGKGEEESDSFSEERMLLELCADGGKVTLTQRENDLTLGMKLHSLKIEDKLQGHVSSTCKYLARSVLKNDDQNTVDEDVEKYSPESVTKILDEDDYFKDALSDFSGSCDNLSVMPSNLSSLYDSPRDSSCDFETTVINTKADLSSGALTLGEVQGDEKDSVDFISVTFVTRQPDSPAYDGTDTQMSICMTKLDFFCNRSTVVALIDFGMDLSELMERLYDNAPSQNDIIGNVPVPSENIEDVERVLVKGLLGNGKSRVVFQLKMNVDSVCIFLNKEDGSQLAMLVQERFQMDLKVHPSSISIEGMLGNLKICDMSLGPEHWWGWLCDIRDPGSDSLVKWKFQSFSRDEDDFHGYDYSLSGRLSAVRIVFLYRFIQEVTAYFMGLATPQAQQAIRVVDKVRGVEWLIQQSEMEGSPAVKLDVSLDTPIIIMPHNSMSKDFMQLDLGHLQVSNKFEWHGCKETDPSAVHLDVIQAEISGINMVVGVDGQPGKSMIQEASGLRIKVCRSLRDVFRKVPEVAVDIQVDLLHGVMSDKEYMVIIDCASSNLSEVANLPPYVREIPEGKLSVLQVEKPSEQVEPNQSTASHEDQETSQDGLSHTLLLVTVEIQNVSMELYNGIDRESPLARMDLQGLWVAYRTSSISEIDLYVTLPTLSVMDLRPSTKPEMRLMLGSMADVEKNEIHNDSGLPTEYEIPKLTMLVMDWRVKPDSQALVVRIQQPRLLVVLDFLLAVGEYFVPSLGAITGREEAMYVENDPVTRCDHIRLNSSLHEQKEDVVFLSPDRQLIADAYDVDEFTYDGCGKTICLIEKNHLKGNSCLSFRPFIIVGYGKKLCFKNVKIEAVAPELTFYDSTKWSSEIILTREKLLRAKMDFNLMYAAKESDRWVRGLVKGLTVESGSGLAMLDPVDISGEYSCVQDKTSISVITTDIYIHLSFSILRLLQRLQDEAVAALQFGSANVISSCTHFNRIWVDRTGNGSNQHIAIWRPRPPSNYVILGDCVTSGSVPPSQAVMAVSNTYGRVKKPLGFKLIWTLNSTVGLEPELQEPDGESGCSIWIPIAPSGYSALGCVAQIGKAPPSNSVVYCIRSDLLTSTMYSDCIYYIPPDSRNQNGFSIWRVENAFGSFLALTSVEPPSKSIVCDLRETLRRNYNERGLHSKISTSDTSSESNVGNNLNLDGKPSTSRSEGTVSMARLARYYISTPKFELIWWDKGSETRRAVSIWRPIPPPGYAFVGDSIVEGLDPPGLGVVLRDDDSRRLGKPTGFKKLQMSGKNVDDLFIWIPIAPPGYVSLGCIASRLGTSAPADSFRCVRMDLVNQANMSKKAVWSFSGLKGSRDCSLWRVENQASTFIAQPELKRPPSRMAYSLVEAGKPKLRENFNAEAKIGCLSLSLIDNLYGMMTPLVDSTMTNISLAAHGRLEALNVVLVSSVAASSFNPQLEVWEPLIEPFDGIFKYEAYAANPDLPLRVGKRIRITATNVVNLNITSANVETLISSILSWRKQVEHEQQARIVKELEKEANNSAESLPSPNSSALEEDNCEKVIIENQLGCDLYLRQYTSNFQDLELLKPDRSSLVHLPPLKFTDRLNAVTETNASRRYVAVHILEAKELPLTDAGNAYNFFCVLRLVTTKQTPEDQSPFPQSARSRCVKPLSLKRNDYLVGAVNWNEVFIFEVPNQGLTSLEVVVTNLAAKAGKGEAVGMFTIPIKGDLDFSNSQPSLPSIMQKSSGKSFCTVGLQPLKRKGLNNHEDENSYCGSISLNTFYFIPKGNRTTRGESENRFNSGEVGLWIGLSRDGPWTSFRSILPLSTIPKQLNETFGFEVVMKQGQKHAILRSLVTIVNDTDISIQVCVCPHSLLNSPDVRPNSDTRPAVITEEIFENQRYNPLSGWGNKWNSFGASTDPGRWSTNDYSYSSKDFFEPPLPSGWEWTSNWGVDKSQFVDSDGWAYGSDFQSLKWPLTSVKTCKRSTFDFARRRRWVQTRKQLPGSKARHSREVITVLKPGCSVPLPWHYTAKDLDFCVQVRPFSVSAQTSYLWGRAISTRSSSSTSGSDQNKSGAAVSLFKLSQLEKIEEALVCLPESGLKQYVWLSMETDANILYSQLNSPVYDWTISVKAPLKLENRLPCNAEFIVWEKANDGGKVKRQHGLISPESSTQIYSVDIRKPIYLTCLAQGGWELEKEAVLICDPSLDTAPPCFWMLHRQSKRKLQVSLERDFGETNAAAKSVRLFVPYWVCNDASLPLAYRLVEIEPSDSSEADTFLIPRAIKAGKQASDNPSKTIRKRKTSLHKVVQILEELEDLNGMPVMLSPQTYSHRSGFLPFSPRDEKNLLSPRLGISVAILKSNSYSLGISLSDFEDKERVDVNAANSNGEYYKLSAFLDMASERTKVVHFQPHTLFVNRTGYRLLLQQCGIGHIEWIYPTDPPKNFLWQSVFGKEQLQISIDGYKWSHPFSIDGEGILHISLRSEERNQLYLRVEIQNGVKDSRFLVVFRHASVSSSYRIENRSAVLPIRFRQVGGDDNSWQFLQPSSAISYAWEDLHRERLLEVLVDGADPRKSCKYNIDEVADHQPMATESGPVTALHVTVLKEGTTRVVKVADWMPSNENLAIVPVGVPISLPSSEQNTPIVGSDNQFHIIIELSEFGLSVVDHTPEELLYLSVQNLIMSYATGLGSGISRFKLRLDGLQVDNQLPLTPMAVLFRPQIATNQLEFLLKFTIVMQDHGSPDNYVYPYFGLQGPSSQNVLFMVKIHEPFIWRLHEMFQKLNVGRLNSSQTTDVAVDPIIRIGLLNMPEIRFKVSLAMSPTQRPRGVLGFWASLMTALGNTENMPVRIAAHVHEDICMRQSELLAAAISNVRKDLLSQPLQLIYGVDILGNASSALGHMSKGVAALSMDKKFIQSRQRQDSKGSVEDIGDVIREGGGAFAKGLIRGVTGIVTKPLEGAKSSGVEGFVQGVGKGIIGVAAQPMSGVLDLLSKTTEGANAMRMKIAAAITSEEQLLRRRLPRAISGDNVLRPYDEYKAQGQVLLQLAERGALFGQIDFFKVRGKFAFSDAYEDHYNLPKGRTAIITHRRVMLLQSPTSVVQRKSDPSREPCTIVWDVVWDDLVSVELRNGKKDPPGYQPSRVILNLRHSSQDSRIFESKETMRVIKCHRESRQAEEIHNAIQQARNTYRSNRSGIQSQVLEKKKVRKPYAGVSAGAGTGASFGFFTGMVAPITIPVTTTFGTLLGTVAGQSIFGRGPDSLSNHDTRHAQQKDMEYTLALPSSSYSNSASGKFINQLTLVWSDKKLYWNRNYQISVWRPICPNGYISVGDIVQRSYNPPASVMVYANRSDGRFIQPVGFDLIWRNTDSGTRDTLAIWIPHPPPGYVAIGCVVIPDYYEPDPCLAYCVREDCVKNVDFEKQPLLRDHRDGDLWECSIWRVQNDAHTFIARRDHQAPSQNIAYSVLT